MRDYHLQTPQKPNRLLKSVSDHSKKNQNIVKKNLNASLSAVSEDASVESPENLIDYTPISEISENNLISEPSEDLTASLSVEASPRSEAPASSVLTPMSSTITTDDYEKEVTSINQSIIAKSGNVSLSCIEAELVVKHLKEAQFQIFKARSMDLQSKRLLDALISFTIKEFYGMPDEEGKNEFLPRKAYMTFLSFLLSILAATLVLILFSSSQHAFHGPTPT